MAFPKISVGHFFDQVHVLLFVRNILGALSGNKNNVFEDLGGSIHKQHERQQQHNTAQQYSTALTAIILTRNPTTEGC